ncbi:MAG: hypothetical protein QOD78_1978, partial [Chloroflexota bacterium]|nr:hypothetical protein [Chloroflexota bacterium]
MPDLDDTLHWMHLCALIPRDFVGLGPNRAIP